MATTIHASDTASPTISMRKINHEIHFDFPKLLEFNNIVELEKMRSLVTLVYGICMLACIFSLSRTLIRFLHWIISFSLIWTVNGKPPSAKSTMEVCEQELPANKLCGLGMQGCIYIHGK